MTGTISFLGFGSGQDYSTMIDALVNARRIAHINPLQNWQWDWESKLESISAVDSALSSFYSTVRGMDRTGEFMARSATSSDSSVLSASSSSSAASGSYYIEVGNAIKHRLGSDGKADKDSSYFAANGNSLDISVAGSTDTITFGSNLTLEEIASQINIQTSLVEAYVINDGSGTNPFRLVLTSSDGGSSNTISISSNTTNVDFSMSGSGDRIDDVEWAARLDDVVETSWSGSSAATSAGSYSGTTNKTFSFQVTSVTGSGTVGTDEITIHWDDGECNDGDITCDDSYAAGELTDVFQGIRISLSEGDVINGDSFSIDAWHDGALGSGAPISTGGQYLGTTNKTFSFQVTSITGAGTVGTDEITIHWDDGEGNDGNITFDDSYTAGELTDVFQGVQISLGAGTMKGDETFSMDIWHPDLQAGQDEGVAMSEKEVHAGFSDTDTSAVTLAEGTFSYTYSGQETTLTVSAGTTLSELKNMINNDSRNTGITASILNDGSGLSTAYHLILSGNHTGAANKITSISHTLDNFGNTFIETQAAQNSMVKVNHYPPGNEYLQHTNNHLTNLIEGITLDIISSGTSTVTVSTDKDAIIEKVQSFTDAFNNVRTAILEETRYNSTTDEKGSLLGNYAVQIIKSRLDHLVSGSAPGFSDDYDTYINLQQVGFATDVAEGSETEGLIVLDTSKLSTALDNDPDAVGDVFGAYFKGMTNDTQISFNSSLSTATPGYYNIEVNMDNEDPPGTPAPLGRFKIEAGEWGEWTALTGSDGDYNLTGISGPEKGIAVDVTYTVESGTHSTELRLKNGVMAELSSELENLLSTSGPLNTLDNNYNDIIDNISDRIEDEEQRLLKYEKMLINRFARLDEYVSIMTQMSNGFSTMLNQNS